MYLIILSLSVNILIYKKMKYILKFLAYVSLSPLLSKLVHNIENFKSMGQNLGRKGECG